MGTAKVTVRRVAKRKDGNAVATIYSSSRTEVSGTPKTIKVTKTVVRKGVPSVRYSKIN